MSQRVCFVDIETGPASPDVLAKLKPEFAANKTLKDPDKIKADLAAREAEWLDRAALSAETGKVLVIGVLEDDKPTYFEGNEGTILGAFWPWLDLQLGAGNIVAGFCIFHFDLPFLVRRSYSLGVRVGLNRFRGRYWHENIIDIAEQWQLGNREQRISLDMLARVLGIPGKLGSGADFAGLYATDREAALRYLAQDLKICQAAYQRMNPV